MLPQGLGQRGAAKTEAYKSKERNWHERTSLVRNAGWQTDFSKMGFFGSWTDRNPRKFKALKGFRWKSEPFFIIVKWVPFAFVFVTSGTAVWPWAVCLCVIAGLRTLTIILMSLLLHRTTTRVLPPRGTSRTRQAPRVHSLHRPPAATTRPMAKPHPHPDTKVSTLFIDVTMCWWCVVVVFQLSLSTGNLHF